MASAKQISICTTNGEDYHCGSAHRHLISKINLPPNACYVHDCSRCVTAIETYILTEDFKLIKPSHFILLNEPGVETKVENSIYECTSLEYEVCNIQTHNVSGTSDFCKRYKCVDSAKCQCHLTHEKRFYYTRTLTTGSKIQH
ncbi:hypothetical protein JTE90_018677 [Oedothorax gibbosus]|uniref:Phlebovirus glycoprotein G2 fusion domain-containing protein n=1 Tax=Oedothorax gibbosus TaxID=931172 RepID=A0AAV6V1Y7_9ARAC|nr:hypothetical protein JTE90_018677 [Oedothorax gibbosus]